MSRRSRLRYIQTLDPERDYEEIFTLVTRYEFPWDYNTGYSFAFATDFVIPAIAHMLAATGEFAHHSMKRYDDTMLFPFEAHRFGLESPHGRDTMRALNKIHSNYEIANDDYLHILTSHLVASIDWINAYAWRRLSPHEERALVLTHRRFGELMGIKGIPADFDGFRSWLERDRRERGVWHYANNAMAYTVLRIIASLCPPGTRAMVKRGVIALMDDHTRELLDLPVQPRWLGTVGRWGLRTRGRFVRWLPPRPDSQAYERAPRSYPLGWTIGHLGPDHLHVRRSDTGA
ncbi:oxygenase MpaB family protein [Nocardia sp. NPDC051756]|uniref:oxygenase MpaB family protein n=1 Tax=Nocardia sp. NPDC051756 TaxID=3154751 RepID=UPI0034472BC8